jgi:hypothetical protein
MNKTELKDFSAFLCTIAEIYNRKLTEAALLLYFDTLKDLEFTQIRKAVKAHCEDPDNGKFFPLPAHIRAYLCKPPKSGLMAWAQVERAIFKQGYYSTVQFEDGTINAVIKDLGGWQWLCSQNIDEPWTQKEFERRYEAYRASGIQLHEPMVGFFESDNRNRNFLDYVPETILISDNGETKLLEPHFDKQLPESVGEVISIFAKKMKM